MDCYIEITVEGNLVEAKDVIQTYLNSFSPVDRFIDTPWRRKAVNSSLSLL